MIRREISPRKGWKNFVEKKLGFRFHSLDTPYWSEEAYYEFTSAEVDLLEAATTELHDLCIQLLYDIIDDESQLHRLGVPEALFPLIRNSWNEDHFYLYGRMDLAYDGKAPPRLLEYNADTPTSLLEASVIQWQWLEERFPGRDQYNSIHEKLIDRWKLLDGKPVHFSYFPNEYSEDEDTVSYLLDTFLQSKGGEGHILALDQIGYDGKRLLDDRNRVIENHFKLYPWNWLCEEEFFRGIRKEDHWIEPAWKTVLSSKALLALLWEKHPGHPNLLETSFQPLSGDYVEKPAFSREGAQVRILRGGTEIARTEGPEESQIRIYQRYYELPEFDGNHPVLGSWIIGNTACGMGIREDRSLVTGNRSRFVPHLF